MKNKLNLDNDSGEVIAFSLELLFLTLVNITLVLLVSWITDSFKESLIVLTVIFLLRSFSGGAHCSSAVRCTILSILLIPSFGALSIFTSQYTSQTFLIFLSVFCILLSFTSISILAPVDSPAKPIVSFSHRRKLRILSFSFLAFIVLIQFVLIELKPESATSFIIAINISIFWQSLMLTKQGHTVINGCDKFLIYLFKKGGEKDEVRPIYRSS